MGILTELFAFPVRWGKRVGETPLPQPVQPPMRRTSYATATIPSIAYAEPVRREGELWRGPSGHWFTLRNGHVHPANDPSAQPKPTAVKQPTQPKPVQPTQQPQTQPTQQLQPQSSSFVSPHAPANPSAPWAGVVNGVWGMFQSATGGAKDLLAAALHNGGIHDPEELTNPPDDSGVDYPRLGRQIAAMWEYAHQRKDTATSKTLEQALSLFGATPATKPGAIIPLDASVYDMPEGGGFFTGDAVRVEQPAIIAPRSDGGTWVLRKGVISRI